MLTGLGSGVIGALGTNRKGGGEEALSVWSSFDVGTADISGTVPVSTILCARRFRDSRYV